MRQTGSMGSESRELARSQEASKSSTGSPTLRSVRRPRYPRRQVDRRPEPIAVALHRRAGVQADPDAGKAVARPPLQDDAEREADRTGSGVAEYHHRVAEGLDLVGPVLSQQRACVLEEPCRELGRLLIAVHLGEGGESGEVGEEEGVLVAVAHQWPN